MFLCVCVVCGSTVEEKGVYLIFDHLSLRYQCNMKVVTFSRKSDCWMGKK